MAEAVPEKSMRTDARRNREKLVRAAIDVFAEAGADASLEAVAKRAGVGIGTLYRNFPTRNDLIAAAYLNEVDQLGKAATDLLADNPPDVALELWFDRFVDYASTKRGMIGALQKMMASKDDLSSTARDTIVSALTLLLGAGAEAGTIRADLDAEDVLRSMGSIWLIDDEDAWPDQPRRVLGLLMDGLRHLPGA